jgi:hypothetical protein
MYLVFIKVNGGDFCHLLIAKATHFMIFQTEITDYHGNKQRVLEAKTSMEEN